MLQTHNHSKIAHITLNAYTQTLPGTNEKATSTVMKVIKMMF